MPYCSCNLPSRYSRFPADFFRSSSVSFPHLALMTPTSCCHWPSTVSLVHDALTCCESDLDIAACTYSLGDRCSAVGALAYAALAVLLRPGPAHHSSSHRLAEEAADGKIAAPAANWGVSSGQKAREQQPDGPLALPAQQELQGRTAGKFPRRAASQCVMCFDHFRIEYLLQLRTGLRQACCGPDGFNLGVH